MTPRALRRASYLRRDPAGASLGCIAGVLLYLGGVGVLLVAGLVVMRAAGAL